MKKFLIALLALMIIVAVSFGYVYGFMWFLSWCFDTVFSMKKVIGVYVIVCHWVWILSQYLDR